MTEPKRPRGLTPPSTVSRPAASESAGRVLPFRPRRHVSPSDDGGLLATLRRRAGMSSGDRRSTVRRLRRHPLLRLVRPFLIAIAIVGAPVTIVGWTLTSPQFALVEIQVIVEDGGRVSEAWVREKLAPFERQNLPQLPLEWIDRELAAHAWVAGADIRKELPARLHVRVIEKRAVALLRKSTDSGLAELVYLDDNGQEIAPFAPTVLESPFSAGETMTAKEIMADGDLLVVSSHLENVDLRPALAVGREVEDVAGRGGAVWATELAEIEVLGERDFRLWSAGLGFPLLVRSGTLARKNAYFEALLPEIDRRYPRIEAVDLRFARRIIVQPSGGRAAGDHERGMGG